MSKTTTQTGLTSDQRIRILELAIPAADDTYRNELETALKNAKQGAAFVAPKDNRLSLTIRAGRKYAAFVENAPKEDDEVETPVSTK